MRKSTSKPLKNRKKLSPLGFLEVLSDPVSYKILMHIKNNPMKPANKIYRALKMEQSVCSAKVRKLREDGFVNTLKDGRKVLHSLDEARFNFAAKKILEKFL